MSSFKPSALVLALCAAAALGSPAGAQELAGAPNAGGPDMGPPPSTEDAPAPVARHRWDHARRTEGKECWAQVRSAPTYAPPPTGPQYVWRQAPAPPGAPGPVWCLTVEPVQTAPAMTAPARLGWIRVLCADDATPGRVSTIQRRLHERGLYRGEMNGRFDEETAGAVAEFQHQSGIEHRGYLSYETVSALQAWTPPPPRVIYWRRPTTFERGYLDWPGKSYYQ